MSNNPTSEPSLEKVFDRIFSLRKITREDQNLLMSTLLSKSGLDESDRTQITRVFDGLQRGFIKVVD